MKKIRVILTALLLAVSAFYCGAVFSNNGGPAVFVNGRNIGAEAILQNDRTYVPLRAVGEALGAVVGWNEEAYAASVDWDADGKSEAADDETAIRLIGNISPAVVAIVGNHSDAVSGYQDKYAQGMAFGSGVIIRSGGEILTNAHVVDGLSNIAVVLHDGSVYAGAVKYMDKPSDLAVVKIDKIGLPTAKISENDAISVGQSVVAIGTPLSFSLRNSASKGVVSGMDRGLGGDYALIQTDASINPGNSGGPLIDMRGEIIGLNSSKFAAVGVEGIGFAVTANTIRYALNQFERYGEIRRTGLSVTLGESWAARRSLPTNDGLTVERAEGSAETEGLRAGDVILSVNGAAVHSKVDFNEQMKYFNKGDKTNFSVRREGNEITLELTLS